MKRYALKFTQQMIDNRGNGKDTFLNVWKRYYMRMKTRPSTTDPTVRGTGWNPPFQSL